ncbi:MAG: type IV pilin protein [Formosimonas sp.]
MKKQQGFTLLELLVVIAIIGILATLGANRYRQHIESAHRQAAIATLQLTQQSMERAFLRNNTYVNAVIAAQVQQNMPPSHMFNFIATNNTYVLTATSNNDTLCGNLTIDQTGLKTESGTANNIDECW